MERLSSKITEDKRRMERDKRKWKSEADAIKTQDRILLRLAIQDRNREAIRQVNTIYYPNIKRYIASRIDSIEDVEDLTQMVFLKFARKRDNEEYHSAEAYLLKIAQDLAALYYRNRSKQPNTISIDAICEIASDVQQKPAEQISQQELRSLIARLPPKTKEAIRLIFIEGLSLKEAAESTDCSLHTFCQRIYEGKKILKKLKPGFDEER